MNKLKERMKQGRLYCDGGTGSLLQAKGLKGGELPERWNLSRPEDIIEVAEGYFRAGSDIVNTNTFGANRLHYEDPEELASIIRAGVSCVREGMQRAGRSDGFVALDIGPTGRLLSPMGDLPFAEAVDIFAQVVKVGAEAGADLIFIETMSDSMEAKAAVLAAKENSSLPIFITCVFDESGKMLTGGTPSTMVAMLEGLRVDALGLNCSLGPDKLYPIAKAFMEKAHIPVICNPNAGLPRSEGGKTVYDLMPEDFASQMKRIAELGVPILGGCCGTTPAYIKETIALTRDIPVLPPQGKRETVISSFSQALTIGEVPLLIGERINPTGKKKFKEALRALDYDYLLSQGIEQEEAGAHILDVNVGLPEISEKEVLKELIQRLQSILALPLQIDTTNPAALEGALRLYNGKPLINSVNGKQESLDTVLPLVAKYGGVVVGLCLDEEGIPETAEGRLAIAKKILEACESYGIPKEDLVIDALAMTVSMDTASPMVTLETLRLVKEELQLPTILGVSNISFGLPQREIVNASFFTLALHEGLSLAIMNPNSSAMMASYRASLALLNKDPGCSAYLSTYQDKKDMTYGLLPKASPLPGMVAAEKKGEGSAKDGSQAEKGSALEQTGERKEGATLTPLMEAIRHGFTEKAGALATTLLAQGAEPLDLVNKEIIPALDLVGKGFEKGTLFLPQLLVSAEAARAAFDQVKEALSSTPTKSKGRMILATVKGDIHDIGKNIVKVLLENYGFDVLDLGKDVPPEVIVDTAIKENISLIGLSALMTTTVVSMEETIKLLREKKPDTKVVVGGAVMTGAYADSIGADYYAREAMDTVRYADQVLGEKQDKET